MNEKEFIEYLRELNIEVNHLQLEQLNKYFELLIEWNEKINLTAITEKNQVYLKHFYDSATLAKAIDLTKEGNLCDVGTGAGFPGIIIKILFPNLSVVLVDSLNKRINFLNLVIQTLELKKIDAFHERIEDFAAHSKESFDVVTARAVAPLNILLECCLPLVKKDKYFIPMKGNVDEELKNSEKALKLLNSEIIEFIEFNLPLEESHRTLLKIRKNQSTDKKYPRKYSEIKQRPL